MSKRLSGQTNGPAPVGDLDRAERSVLRLGGLGGLLGGTFTILTAIVTFGFAGYSSASSGAESVARFPDVRVAFTLANIFSIVAYILWLALFLGLYRALRGSRLATALFGSLLSVLGLAMLFAGGATAVAFAPISDAYHAPGATAAQQATLALTWQATQGIFNETDTVGGMLVAIAFLVLGLGMLKTPAFGKALGWLSVMFGGLGAVGTSIDFFGTGSFIPAFLVVPVYVILPFLLGWKTYNLSKTASGSTR